VLPHAPFIMFKLRKQPCSVCFDDECLCDTCVTATVHKMAKEDSAHQGTKNTVRRRGIERCGRIPKKEETRACAFRTKLPREIDARGGCASCFADAQFDPGGSIIPQRCLPIPSVVAKSE
jgi:hypothetical protein